MGVTNPPSNDKYQCQVRCLCRKDVAQTLGTAYRTIISRRTMKKTLILSLVAVAVSANAGTLFYDSALTANSLTWG